MLFVTPSLGFHSLQFDVRIFFNRVGEKPPTSCPQILPHLWWTKVEDKDSLKPSRFEAGFGGKYVFLEGGGRRPLSQ